eukprot:m51a1_g9708 hypothetical protein (201) ;mRNA; r:1399691-1400293
MDKVSKVYPLHTAMFRSSPQSRGGGLSYDEARDKCADRFDFKKLDGVFASFLASGVDISSPGSAVFDYDKARWRATIECSTCQSHGKKVFCTSLRLPNDGFLYPDPKKEGMRIFKEPHEVGLRHCSDGWYLLDRSEPGALLPTVVALAEKTLGDALKQKMFYNFASGSLDYLALNGDKEISVLFHHGFPESPFEDFWFDS